MELTTPITIYWDLPSGTADICSLQLMCADIIACRPLMLHLRDPGPEAGEGTVAVLDRLKGVPIAVSLTIPPTALHSAAGALSRDPGLKEILLAVEHVEDISLPLQEDARGGDEIRPGAHQPVMGISFTVTKENWRELPALVTFCREQGIPRLVLPMQRLYNAEIPFFLDRREQRTLAASLAAAGGVEGMNLTIHDPFLWRAFNPGVPFPQGGCQAANTMLAIAPNGDVYPCPTLPVRLGNIGEASLKEIVVSSGKKEFRRRLLEHPAGCRGCTELAECRGGCRGRAYVNHGSLEKADAACG
jgi:GeoRSP system SPASM domain protein